MGDDTLNTSRFTKPALEMTRLEAYTMVAMHAILLGEGGGQLSPEEVGENAAAMAEAEEAEEAKEKEKEGGIASVAGARRRMKARK